MLILGLLGMYFDAAVVFVTSQTLFLRLALAILCTAQLKQCNTELNQGPLFILGLNCKIYYII